MEREATGQAGEGLLEGAERGSVRVAGQEGLIAIFRGRGKCVYF